MKVKKEIPSWVSGEITGKTRASKGRGWEVTWKWTSVCNALNCYLCLCRGQRTVSWSQFSSSTFIRSWRLNSGVRLSRWIPSPTEPHHSLGCFWVDWEWSADSCGTQRSQGGVGWPCGREVIHCGFLFSFHLSLTPAGWLQQGRVVSVKSK